MTVTEQSPLSKTELEQIDAYWRAANYLSVGQIYLMEIRCCGSRCGQTHQAAAAGALGDHARAQPDLRASEPGDPPLGS